MDMSKGKSLMEIMLISASLARRKSVPSNVSA